MNTQFIKDNPTFARAIYLLADYVSRSAPGGDTVTRELTHLVDSMETLFELEQNTPPDHTEQLESDIQSIDEIKEPVPVIPTDDPVKQKAKPKSSDKPLPLPASPDLLPPSDNLLSEIVPKATT